MTRRGGGRATGGRATVDPFEALLVAALAGDEEAVRPEPGAVPRSTRGGPLQGAALRRAVTDQCSAAPDREAWPDWWFAGPDPEDVRRSRRLWAASLFENVREAVREMLWHIDHKAVARPGRLSGGEAWLRSPDFLTCVTLAGLDEGVGLMIRARLLEMREARDADALAAIFAGLTQNQDRGESGHFASVRGAGG